MSVLALGVVFALGACSSKPSPWSQQASPWESQEKMEEAAPVDEAATVEQSPFTDDASAAESSGIAEPMTVEEMAVMEEPVMEEAAVEAEPVMEEEPVMEQAVAGGSIGSQPAGHYAVQVVASSNMENLKAFAGRHQISDELVAETSVDGKTWFVLLQGVYPTMDEAKAALEQVGDSLETSPWIRSIGSLQAAMIQ